MHLTVEISHLAIQQDPNWKYFMFEHAERNAIFGAEKLGKSVKGATMYCTLFPCADCARAIVAASVRRLVVEAPGPANPRDEKWQAHHHYALQILELSGVAIDYAAPKSVSAAAAPLD
jgi:deoxycytidylate deaminase